MFGFARKRLDAMRAARAEAQAMGSHAEADGGPLDPERIEALRQAIAEVADHDLDAVFADPAVEEDYTAAKKVLAALESAEREQARRARRAKEAAESPALAQRLGLSCCARCGGGAMYVRDDVCVEINNGANLDVAVVVCAACGDLRMTLRRRADLARLADDPQYTWVELPTPPPFRGR